MRFQTTRPPCGLARPAGRPCARQNEAISMGAVQTVCGSALARRNITNEAAMPPSAPFHPPAPLNANTASVYIEWRLCRAFFVWSARHFRCKLRKTQEAKKRGDILLKLQGQLDSSSLGYFLLPWHCIAGDTEEDCALNSQFQPFYTACICRCKRLYRKNDARFLRSPTVGIAHSHRWAVTGRIQRGVYQLTARPCVVNLAPMIRARWQIDRPARRSGRAWWNRQAALMRCRDNAESTQRRQMTGLGTFEDLICLGRDAVCGSRNLFAVDARIAVPAARYGRAGAIRPDSRVRRAQNRPTEEAMLCQRLRYGTFTQSAAGNTIR